MEQRNILIYLYLKNKGDWTKIYSDVVGKTPVTDAEVSEAITKEEAMGNKFLTLVDENYPERLKRASQPPFVIKYSEKKKGIMLKTLKLADKGDIALTGVEYSPEIISLLQEHPLYLATTIGLTLPETDGTEKPCVRIQQGKNILGAIICHSQLEALNFLGQVCNQLLAVTAEPEFKIALNRALINNVDVFACPGNSGCECNKLIKGGASLCDTWEDLATVGEPIAEEDK